LWDAATGQQLRTFGWHAGPTNYVAFSPDGRLVPAGAADGSAILWDISKASSVSLGTPGNSATEKATVPPDVSVPLCIQSIPPQMIPAGAELRIPISVDDATLWQGTLRFSLGAGSPAAAAVDTTTGVFTWRPAADGEPGRNDVTVDIERTPSHAIIVPSADEIRQVTQEARRGLALDSFEFAMRMRELTGPIFVYPFRLCEGLPFVLRAKLRPRLAALLPDKRVREALQKPLERVLRIGRKITSRFCFLFRSPGIYAWDAKGTFADRPLSPIRRLRRRIGESGLRIGTLS